MKYTRIIFSAVLLFSSGLTFAAEKPNLGFGVKGGTAGFGADISVQITPSLNARLSLTQIDVEIDETLEVGDSGGEADMVSTFGLDFGSTAILLDWYVSQSSGFHFSAGMLKLNGGIDIDGELQGAVIVDGREIDPSDVVGNIGGEISAGDSFEPYLGIGWGRRTANSPGFLSAPNLAWC